MGQAMIVEEGAAQTRFMTDAPVTAIPLAGNHTGHVQLYAAQARADARPATFAKAKEEDVSGGINAKETSTC
ncbi:hypothetical protein ANCCEY_07861 [Ancylostoma ceylanicum]|uniref:Uncharacterized protein n=1 Tax=Ancylostoma ceylanicum TaxID=53326 RepID=A0A0D6LSN8_9BILA|nr:hypothetical protein ANCCEY_07861 [Ancylostoma ceylanicum]